MQKFIVAYTFETFSGDSRSGRVSFRRPDLTCAEADSFLYATRHAFPEKNPIHIPFLLGLHAFALIVTEADSEPVD